MAFKIEERFEIQAPIEQVWAYLIDPPRVVVCLPGAELTDTIDERTYGGRVRVKVGPVTAAYKGTARLEEVNEAEHLMRLAGEGKETAGAGSAKMAMTGRLSEEEPGRTRVTMEAEIDVAGKMARFGRGVMEDVSRQLFRQFATNLQESLAQPAPLASPTAENSTSRTAERRAAEPAAADAPAAESTAAAPAARRAAGERDRPASPEGAPAAPAASVPPGGPERQGARPDAPPARPVRALPLVFRAIWSRIKRLIGR